jgi:hypothetical protein
VAYNIASAFLPEPPRPKFFPPSPTFPNGLIVESGPLIPFDGPIIGFPPANPALLDLRVKWLNTFLGHLDAISPLIPTKTAVEWVNVWFPKTAEELRKSIMEHGPTKLAMRLADAWKTA